MSSTHPSSTSIHNLTRQPEDVNEDSDGLLEELEQELDNDFDLGGFREKRMMELKAQMETAQRVRESDYGKYTEFKVEKDLITTTAKANRSVVHFFHRDFRRCKIMHAHLEKLAVKYPDTLFVKADVANVPFLVTKLDIKVLPCVVGFANGVSRMKLVGFDELEGGDNFTTASLEIGMKECGVLSKDANALGSMAMPSPLSAGRSSTSRRTRGGADEDFDFDD
ncbi:hypothetical protein JCM11641_002368 [Rhodosporidiobolus odoratus]